MSNDFFRFLFALLIPVAEITLERYLIFFLHKPSIFVIFNYVKLTMEGKNEREKRKE